MSLKGIILRFPKNWEHGIVGEKRAEGEEQGKGEGRGELERMG